MKKESFDILLKLVRHKTDKDISEETRLGNCNSETFHHIKVPNKALGTYKNVRFSMKGHKKN